MQGGGDQGGVLTPHVSGRNKTGQGFRCDCAFSLLDAENSVSMFLKLDRRWNDLGFSLLFDFLRCDINGVAVYPLCWTLEVVSVCSQNWTGVETTSASAFFSSS